MHFDFFFSFGKSSSFSSLQENKKNKIKCQVDLLFVVINTQAFACRWSWAWKQVLPVVMLLKVVLRALKGQMYKEWKSQLQPVALGQCPSVRAWPQKKGSMKPCDRGRATGLAAPDCTCDETAKKGRADIFRAGGGEWLPENREIPKPHAAEYVHAQFLVEEATWDFSLSQSNVVDKKALSSQGDFLRPSQTSSTLLRGSFS